MQLLTSSPLEIMFKSVHSEYVAVKQLYFDKVTLKLRHSYLKDKLYSGTHSLVIVLHFVPHKRRHVGDDVPHDAMKKSRRHV